MKGQGIVNAKAASMAWVEGLQLGNSECALTTFNTQNYFIQDFTIDKNKLLNAIIGFGTEGGTDFNAGFIKPMGGALLVAEKGKYKKVVVFITDGMAIGMESSIILKAKSKNITVYCVTLNMQCPSILRNIATQTGGQWFEKVTTKEKAEEVYRMILQSSLGLEPCEIEWESGVPCIAEIRNVELQIKNFGIKVTSNYQIPITSEAKLEFNPNIVKFLNPEVGVKIEEKVTVTARNDNFTVLNITGNNAAFTISPTNFLLKEGESEEFTISYLPFDSAYNNCKFEIESEKCPISFYASGGYRGKKPNVQSLKLTHPNGGETFVVGSDSLITWEGIPPSEKVILEYSADKGQNWKSIIRNVSGLSYNWKNIPGPTSKQCLVRVSQSERLDGSDPIDSPPKIEWQQIYGGSHTEIAKTFTKTRDGGYIVAGFTWSKDGDITHQNGYNDFLILKLRFDGSLEWQKTYGGSRFDEANSIQQTTDGGYIVAGFTDSHDGDVTEEKGYNDIWLLKLSRDGILEWQKSYGGSLWEVPNSIKETSDGGYIVTGTTSSSDGDITEQKGHGDAWVLKLSINGNIEWQKTYGGKESDLIACIQKTKDGGYIVVGYTVSNDGDVIMNKGHDDLWVLKLRIDGSIKWQKTFGGGNSDRGTFIQVTSDGGYIVAGWTYSIDGDVTEYKGSADIWVLKIGIDGSLEWQKSYGGSGEDIAYSIKESSYGGYILVGTTESNDGDVTEFKGDIDIWVLKLSLDGNIEWQKTLGGSYIDRAYSSQETGDGGYILAGSAALNDGDVIENLGGADVWIVKLAGTTILQSDVSDAVFSIVELIASSRDIDMLQVLVGSAKDSVVSEFVSNIGSWKFRVDSIYIQGADASAFSLVSGFPVYTIESKQNHFAEFRFVPSRVGIHSAEIVIDTQGETIVQSIIGEGVDPQLQIINSFIDFGAINVGEMVDTLKAVTVKNNSNAPLEILNTKHNYPNNVDFSTINGGGSFTLQPGETHLMDLRFAPSSLGRTSGTLEFHYDGVGSPAIVQLFGTGHLEPKIISFSPLCVGDLLYLFTNEVYKGRYHWMGPNKYTSEQRYVVIPNAQLHHSGRYSLYIEIEGAMTDTTYFDVLVNENIVTPNDESLVFLGNTKRDDLHIELTEAKLYNSGAVWMKEKFSFKKDFVTEFKFNYTHGNNGGSEETSLPGADGLAFVILNEFNPALGEKGRMWVYAK
jgi:hypothetical protein